MTTNREEAVSKDRTEKIRKIMDDLRFNIDAHHRDYHYEDFEEAKAALEALMPDKIEKRTSMCLCTACNSSSQCLLLKRNNELEALMPQEVSVDEIRDIVYHNDGEFRDVLLTNFTENTITVLYKQIAQAIHAKIYGKGKEIR